MTITFTIPVCGTEAYLPRCLDSLVAQTDGDFEAIVVDDCSPASDAGSCAEIVSRYDARFRCVRHEKNLSLLQARITGLKAAKGEWIVPLDSDDWAGPELVARLKAEIVANHEADAVVYQMMYEKGKSEWPKVRYADERLSRPEALDRFFASRIQCAICGKCVRREVYLKAVEELGIGQDFYLNSSEDLCQTFPVLMNCRGVSTLAYPGYRYWINTASLTGALTDPVKMGRAAENTARVFGLLKDFVRRRQAKETGEELVARLDLFMMPTLEWYLGCIRHEPEENWRACVAELCRYFPPDLVARKAMTLIENSRTFRLGAMFTVPFRWLSGRSGE